MKLILFLSALIIPMSNAVFATEFEKLGALYDASEMDPQKGWSSLRKPSLWTGKCATARNPDKLMGGYFMTYDPKEGGVFTREPYGGFRVIIDEKNPLNSTDEVDDEGIKSLFDGGKESAYQIIMYLNDLAWVRGRGYEVTTIRPEFDGDTISRIHTLMTCIGDEETCNSRAIVKGRWRHCLFDKKRL